MVIGISTADALVRSIHLSNPALSATGVVHKLRNRGIPKWLQYYNRGSGGWQWGWSTVDSEGITCNCLNGNCFVFLQLLHPQAAWSPGPWGEASGGDHGLSQPWGQWVLPMQIQKDSATWSLVVEKADVVGVVLLGNLHFSLRLQAMGSPSPPRLLLPRITCSAACAPCAIVVTTSI